MSTRSECNNFLKIKREKSDTYTTIDIFIKENPNISIEELYKCYISYRKKEMRYEEYMSTERDFLKAMRSIDFFPSPFITCKHIRYSIDFIIKAIECLAFAGFFTEKSSILLDIDHNIRWSTGYASQFFVRCIYFGTSTTWYANTFDHILQAVWWGEKLYKENDIEKILKSCRYETIIKELDKYKKTELKELLISCNTKIKLVREWSNSIKHRGGINYKYIKPISPLKIHKVENFNPLHEVDIDDNKKELINAYNTLRECIEKLIEYMDYDQYSHLPRKL